MHQGWIIDPRETAAGTTTPSRPTGPEHNTDGSNWDVNTTPPAPTKFNFGTEI